MSDDVIVIGAGVSGLACARVLARAGASVRVLERARGVGGRCATRRVEGQPVDHGAAFYHGRDAELLAELEATDPRGVLHGWPRRVEGEGRPCSPRSLARGTWRLAFAGGATAFAKHLARDLDVALETRAAALSEVPGGVEVRTAAGAVFRARRVALALPAAQAVPLLDTLAPAPRAYEAIRALLVLAEGVPSLTVIARYPSDVPEPSWDLLHPADVASLQVVSHDSAKRVAPRYRILVLQAPPAFSLARVGADPSVWSAEMLAAAADAVGAWAGRPEGLGTHRWRWARARRDVEYAAPVDLRLERGGEIGIVGETFAPGGGIEAAWRSGRILAERWGRGA